MNVDSKYTISFHKLTIYLLIFDAQYIISIIILIKKYINTPWNTKNYKESPKLMLTRHTFDIPKY